MTIQDVLDLLNAGGTLAALAIIILGFMTKRIVPGWVYDDAAKREQEWRQLAMGATDLGYRAAKVASDIVRSKGGP